MFILRRHHLLLVLLPVVAVDGQPLKRRLFSAVCVCSELSFTAGSDAAKSLATGAIDGDGPAVHCATVHVNIRCIRRAG